MKHFPGFRLCGYYNSPNLRVVCQLFPQVWNDLSRCRLPCFSFQQQRTKALWFCYEETTSQGINVSKCFMLQLRHILISLNSFGNAKAFFFFFWIKIFNSFQLPCVDEVSFINIFCSRVKPLRPHLYEVINKQRMMLLKFVTTLNLSGINLCCPQ